MGLLSLDSIPGNNCETQTLPNPCGPNYSVSTATEKKWFLLWPSHSQFKYQGQKAQTTHHYCFFSSRTPPSTFSSCHENNSSHSFFVSSLPVTSQDA